MKISIECGARNRYPDIKEALANCQDVKFEFVGMDPHNAIALIYEVATDDEKTAIALAEKQIRSTKYGKITSFRVVPYGSIVYYKSH